MPKKKETPSAKTDPPHKSSKSGTPSNNKKPEDIKALDHSEPLKIAEVRESKKPVTKMQEPPILKESMKVEIEELEDVVPPVEESKDIEVFEEEPVAEGSYQEDFNDSLGGGGIEQSSKLNIKKEKELHDQKNIETKNEEVSKNDH